MSKSLFLFSMVIISQISFSFSAVCKEGSNNCAKCNPVTKLCVKCDKEIYTLNKNGECEPSIACTVGENYCIECSEDGSLCKKCDGDYFPDENGACAYSDNCQISYQGVCLKCLKGYVLIGKTGVCKSTDTEDFKNCKKSSGGFCTECEEGFYLNEGDKRCTTTKNCFESSFGICTKCISGFYLDKKGKECKKQDDAFINCKISTDGKTCEECIDDYFFDEDGLCANSKYCSKSVKGQCKKCVKGYYLSNTDKICTTEEQCEKARGDLGLCLACAKDYAIDLSDGKCKSNKEDNDLKYCESAEGKCNKCISGFELGRDNKCSTSTNCAESDKGLCQTCIDNYYIGLDFKCTSVKHCIKSYEYECIECEEKFYYNRDNKTCFTAEGKYKNCQYGVNEFCLRCNDDFYLNRKDHLCYSNQEKNDFYKCAMTDIPGEKCFVCKEDYYLGIKDFKCSKAEDCDITEDENRCAECRENYCLNVKTGLCVFNYEIDEENKFYYKCKKTNEEGTQCEICIEGYTLDKTGVCV